jgi:transposase
MTRVDCAVSTPHSARVNGGRDADYRVRFAPAENRFPSISMPDAERRDLRALLRHRDHWVRLRTRVMNGLQGLALAHGIRRRAGLWSDAGRAELAAWRLRPHEGERRAAMQALYEELSTQIQALDQRVAAQATARPQASRLMTHPGVGPVTALATDVFLGDPTRFADAKAVASYVGIIPSEYASGDRQRLGRLSKQGNPMVRFLWCEAAIHAVRRDAALGRF